MIEFQYKANEASYDYFYLCSWFKNKTLFDIRNQDNDMHDQSIVALSCGWWSAGGRTWGTHNAEEVEMAFL